MSQIFAQGRRRGHRSRTFGLKVRDEVSLRAGYTHLGTGSISKRAAAVKAIERGDVQRSKFINSGGVCSEEAQSTTDSEQNSDVDNQNTSGNIRKYSKLGDARSKMLRSYTSGAPVFCRSELITRITRVRRTAVSDTYGILNVGFGLEQNVFEASTYYGGNNVLGRVAGVKVWMLPPVATPEHHDTITALFVVPAVTPTPSGMKYPSVDDYPTDLIPDANKLQVGQRATIINADRDIDWIYVGGWTADELFSSNVQQPMISLTADKKLIQSIFSLGIVDASNGNVWTQEFELMYEVSFAVPIPVLTNIVIAEASHSVYDAQFTGNSKNVRGFGEVDAVANIQ